MTAITYKEKIEFLEEMGSIERYRLNSEINDNPMYSSEQRVSMSKDLLYRTVLFNAIIQDLYRLENLEK